MGIKIVVRSYLCTFMAYRYVDKVYPFNLSPEALDWYLARGWYRMGANIFTTHYLCFQQQLYSAIWIRLDLRKSEQRESLPKEESNFQFSKSQRRLLRKNAKLFTYTVGRRKFTLEKELLYNRYAQQFNGRLSPSLRDNLEDYDDESIFRTYEVCIREKETNRLVAASYFDLGRKSAASILGIYEPDFDQYSLGYYSMLIEMEYCYQQGLEYYYPGYIVPGYKRFDYKMRIGKTDYFDVKTGKWLSLENFERNMGPAERQLDALGDLQRSIDGIVSLSETLIYPLFEARLYHAWPDSFLEQPCLLLLGNRPSRQGQCVCVIFDPVSDEYILLLCQSMGDIRYYFSEKYLKSFPPESFLVALLDRSAVLQRTSNKEKLTEYLIKSLQ
ncbi:MAG: arginine-tRNA-protein transferase [Bacteroidota bacterium]